MRRNNTSYGYALPEPNCSEADPYRYSKRLIESAMEMPGEISRTDGIEDLLSIKKDQAAELAAMIASNLGSIQKTYLTNLEAIEIDIIAADNLIRRLPFDKRYYFSKERIDLEKIKFGLRAERRKERSSRNQASAMLLKELREAILAYKKEHKESSLLGLEGTINDDERTNS